MVTALTSKVSKGMCSILEGDIISKRTIAELLPLLSCERQKVISNFVFMLEDVIRRNLA